MQAGNVQPATPEAVAAAARLLQSGRLVAFPTETVYGLGADAGNAAAVAAIFAAKGRPSHNPLIVHVPDAAAAAPLAAWSAAAARLAAAFWPGPLTLVLARRPGSVLCPQVSAGGETVALRAPDHAVAQALLRAAGLPLAAPSANRSGAVSPTTARHVAAETFPEAGPAPALILDGGPCPVGVESTVLDLTGAVPRLLRPGGIPREALARVLECAVAEPAAAAAGAAMGRPLRAPGQLASHYAPGLPVRLNVTAPVPGEAWLGFGGTAGATLDLSPAGDLAEAARNLFAMLRSLDRPPFRGIAVAPIPDRGLGHALNDRLSRAAAPREVP